MIGTVYLDTSVLAKVYVNERRSSAVLSFLGERSGSCISHLSFVEMRLLLSRRRRMGDLDRSREALVFARFRADVEDGQFQVLAASGETILRAASLIHRLHEIALRTLDAVHLAIAENAAINELATADRVMADAAESIGMRVVRFD